MLTRQHIESFNRIKNDPALAPFREWLAEEQAAVDRKLRSVTDDRVVRQLQGCAQFIEKQLNLIEDASAALSKMAQ